MSYVKQPRPLVHEGMRGRDIRAYKRGLHNAKYKSGTFEWLTPGFGGGMLSVLKRFQHDHGLDVDGVIGPLTYAKLYPHFDATCFWFLLNTAPSPPPPTETRRELIGGQMDVMVNHHDVFTWAELRPIPVARIRDHDFSHTIFTDCSGITIGINAAAGAPDPGGNGFDGSGSTASFLSHLRHIDASQMRLGDIVVFGGYPGKHAVSVRSGAAHVRDIRVLSLGHNGGNPDEPAYYPLGIFLDYFAGDPYYCLSLGL